MHVALFLLIDIQLFLNTLKMSLSNFLVLVTNFLRMAHVINKKTPEPPVNRAFHFTIKLVMIRKSMEGLENKCPVQQG